MAIDQNCWKETVANLERAHEFCRSSCGHLQRVPH